MSHDATPHPNAPTPAPRSGGPKTPEGKERSRRNALKHGLRAKVLTPDEMIDDVMNRTADFARQFRPQNAYQEWLVGEIALATVRIDRCAALSIVDLQRRRDLTPEAWDLQRRREVAALGAGLARDPARVRAILETTAHGVDWLIEHWDGLALVLHRRGEWSDAQKQLALHLLGVPLELRRSPTGVSLEVLSRTSQLPEPAKLPAFVSAQLQRLRGLQDALLHDQDDDQRLHSGLGLPVAEDRTSRSLRRYEQSSRRALHWAHAELTRLQSEPADSREPAPEPGPQPPPEPIPPRVADDRLSERIAARGKAPVLSGTEGLLKGDLPAGNHFDLDFPIVPTRSGPGPGSPPRRPRVGTRA